MKWFRCKCGEEQEIGEGYIEELHDGTLVAPFYHCHECKRNGCWMEMKEEETDDR